uniref:K+-dependent Na+/Ca+ exchanger related-protein n=1 Tax=Paulinella micropora TaxID=1928728 RepID=A0A385HZ87_9EUKA|nr:K+-dependent Na+/Ca+ exchanger related-protein [Paulinella micropora]AXY62968.1 K+-dependent Na+/Ca+ exchanger related-protein [Paulinella micropora]
MAETVQLLLYNFLEILLGVLLLFGGGELFVQGSVTLAVTLGIPQLVIGLTLVALGTSAPELFVSITATLQGSADLAVSNVVGSNIFNMMMVLGCSALIVPLQVDKRLVNRDIPLLIIVSMTVWGLASTGRITWQSGVALLVALTINTIWEIFTANEEADSIIEVTSNNSENLEVNHILYASFKVLIATILLVVGSETLVYGATGVARNLGVTETVIGLTIVSVGTSMPELATSVVATIRKRTDLAIGNVIGSNLLNQLLILSSCGLASGSHGLMVQEIIINRDFPIMIFTTLACLPIFWTKNCISRLEGSVLVSLYLMYLLDQVFVLALPTVRVQVGLVILCIAFPTLIIVIFMRALVSWYQKKYFYWINFFQ